MIFLNMIPAIHKPTLAKGKIATAIDHIILIYSGIWHKSGIVKADISDHFPVTFALNTCEKSKPEDKAQFIYECIYGEEQIELFRYELR